MRGGTVSPGGIVDDFGSTQRTRLFAIQPFGHAKLAEHVLTFEQHGRFKFVVTNGALISSGGDLFLRGCRTNSLRTGKVNIETESIRS